MLNLGLNKRQKIIATVILLSAVLLSMRLIPISFYIADRFYIILGFGALAYILSLWSLWEGISLLKGIILLILPTFFAIAVSSYYFLLPVRFAVRIPVAFGFGLIFYILLLSQNIFNVSSIRTIPLYRAASTAVLVLTLVTAFLLFNVIYSFDMLFIWNALIVALVTFPLSIYVLWSLEMERLDAVIITYAMIISLVIGELGLVLSFWPIFHPLASLVLATGLYISLGLTTHSLKDRLTREAVIEYLGWGLGVLIVAILSTSWVS